MYTGMQNENGGYVTDCTISRLGPQQYFLIILFISVNCLYYIEFKRLENDLVRILSPI